MDEKIIELISQELNLNSWQVKNTVQLLNEKATIPFISRYRKEMTGSLDEVQVGDVKNHLEKFTEIIARKKTIIETIKGQEKLTPELEKKINQCWSLPELEDIYLPYKPKKRTRATIAREKGLEPLAKIIMKQYERDITPKIMSFLNDTVESEEQAIQGASDIIAEWVNENERSRNIVRNSFKREAVISSRLVKGKEEEGEKYKDYFEFEELLKKCPSHRLLAMRRGEKEGILRVSISPEEEGAIDKLNNIYVKGYDQCSQIVENAVKDSYKRLLKPSIETEFAQLTKDKADEEAIKVFAANLRQLLMSPPLGPQRILALDPGFRTGCKVVCLDEQGNLLHNETIYPHKPQQKVKDASRKINSLVSMYNIDAIAIGNGTAGRETEHFIKKQVRFSKDIKVFVVDESGASIYSSSSIAREEFPTYDVTVRGAVSIGRRLMDPLAELVKIDPKSIGVGQYQHDVNQTSLKNTLDQEVINCVNQVGVDLNTASKHLLAHISGLGPQLATNIIEYRKENGTFSSRKQLMKVKRMGAKAFEQSAGFLRINNAKNPLDMTAVHPESYKIVEKMAADLNITVGKLISEKDKREAVKLEKYVSDTIGLPTLTDILKELEKPGRDPRKSIKTFEFSDEIRSIDDLKPGMVLPGIINNITNFGAFVDLGIKENGLIHVSQMAEKYISDPMEIVKLHQHLNVKIVSVETDRKRIQLSLIGVEQ